MPKYAKTFKYSQDPKTLTQQIEKLTNYKQRKRNLDLRIKKLEGSEEPKDIRELNKLGVTIILTTHNLSEAQQMCDRIGIINEGNLVALDSTQKLLERIDSKKIKFKVKDTSQFEKIRLDGVKFSKTNSEITAIYDKNKLKIDQIIDVVKNNGEILDIATDEGDLEDIFLQVTNK